MKNNKKLPDAIEAARALVKVSAKSSAKSSTANSSAPIHFERCDIDPRKTDPRDRVAAGTQKLLATGKRRGRPRKQPPVDLRQQMPEHADEAYFDAQSQIHQPADNHSNDGIGGGCVGSPGTNTMVPPSDYHRGGPRLSTDEIDKIVDLYTHEYGAILRLDQAAEITKLSKQTLRRKVCEGKFVTSVFQGTPLRFITRRFIEEVLG